ncbi:Urease accessory protein UreH-like transmembrane domain [Arabidopsis thaliana x Arabidopsis arenosa]|uniref:Urease accessory protein UreH-like transmembrane domain n=2 Tax=Arabidopsis TaxID=3701 RepID=A0A8T1YFT8_ARASU|nr:Urease accessory protein UreH-like transmembrane domain [Arabidopsis thaliana x Arabidopsis arenosa]KAG7545017.1 Urease accessory protein UreH-like transmembrane domain [Arabidopsis suecica]
MERLLQPSSSSSSSISPSKFLSRTSPFLPRLRSSSLGFVSTHRPESRRVSSISCNSYQNPSMYTSIGSNKTNNSFNGSPQSEESKPNPGFLTRIATTASEQRKTLSTGTVILISAVAALLLNPLLAPPAFASFQTAAKSGWLTSAWTGFLAGCLHTLSGPDHLAALAPLSIGRSKMESAAVGALWGCGHDAGQVIFGLLFLLLKDRLHIEVLQTWGTRIVGLTLVIIGAMGIKEASEIPEPCVALETDISMVSTEKEALPLPKKKKIGFATFATGVVHGLQPDALMIVLPALALPSRLAGSAFLIMFLVGTVIAMGSYTAFIGSCSEALKEKVPRITEKLTWVSSLVAIGLGLGIVISPFFGFSLY